MTRQAKKKSPQVARLLTGFPFAGPDELIRVVVRPLIHDIANTAGN